MRAKKGEEEEIEVIASSSYVIFVLFGGNYCGVVLPAVAPRRCLRSALLLFAVELLAPDLEPVSLVAVLPLALAPEVSVEFAPEAPEAPD